MSSNLDLQQVSENQTLKEVSINTMSGQLDAAITEFLSIDVSASDASLTNSQYRRNVMFVASGAAVARVLTVPALKKLSLIRNDGTADVSVTRGSTALVVGAGLVSLIYTDGTTNGLIGVSGGGAAYPAFTGNAGKVLAVNGTEDDVEWIKRPLRIGVSIGGLPVANEILMLYAFDQAASFPAGMTNSQAIAGASATASTTFTVKKNGTSIGTIVFSAAGTVGSFTGFSASSFGAGDVLSLTAPTTPDVTLGAIAFNFVGSSV